MTARVTRASQAALDRLHRKTTRAIEAELDYYLKSKERIPQPLLANAIAFLKATESTAPEKTKPPAGKDPLAKDMPSFADDHRGTPDFSRG